ncbi:MAG: radical SAM protein, partial [Phycisphaeraceae bacterium]
MPAQGLYLHVPFCFHKCHYCDFYSIVDSPASARDHPRRDRQAAFTQALQAELEFHANRAPLSPTTVFVGGGTPTLLRPDLWQLLLKHMQKLGVLERVREFTVEANPETITPQLVTILAAGGVNRVSIGAQSFNTGLLKTLERWHNPDHVEQAVHIIRQGGIDNVNLDLI